MPSEEELDDYYASGAYESGHSGLSQQTSLWQKGPARALAQVDLVMAHCTQRTAWLDVGAGYGYLLDAARQAGFARTCGVEATPARRTSLVERGHETAVALSDTQGEWSVVSASHVLEHVADPVTFLGELSSRLAPEGLLLCEVPNANPVVVSGNDEPHVFFFSERGLRRTIEQAGLTTVHLAASGLPQRGYRTWARARAACTRLSSGRLPEPWARRLAPEAGYGRDRTEFRILARK